MPPRIGPTREVVRATIVGLSVVAAGCHSAATVDGTRAATRYSAEVLMSTHETYLGDVSADGQWVLGVSNSPGTFQLFAYPVAADAAPRQLTTTESGVVSPHGWFPEDGRVLYEADNGGDERMHVKVLAPDGSVADLTPGDEVEASFLRWSTDGTCFWVAIEEPGADGTRIYRYETDDYRRDLVYEVPGDRSVRGISANGRWLILAEYSSNVRSSLHARDLIEERTVQITPDLDGVTHRYADVSPDSRTVLYTTDEHGDFRQAWSYGLDTGARSLAYAAEWDVRRCRYSPLGTYLIVDVVVDALPTTRVVERATGALLELPPMPVGAGSLGLTFARDERTLALQNSGTQVPLDIFFVDRPGPQTPVPITGLPAELTVPDTRVGGVYAVLSLDGSLAVTNYTATRANLHLIGLTGNHASSVRTIPLGNVVPGYTCGAGGLESFPDGRILLATVTPRAFVAGSGVAARSSLTIVDPGAMPAPRLQPVPLSGAPITGFVEGCALSRDGRTAFAASNQGGGAFPYVLHRIDVDTTSPTFGRVENIFTTRTQRFYHPEVGEDGILHVTGINALFRSTEMLEIDTTTTPVTVTALQLAPSNTAVGGPTTDAATGVSVFTSWDVGAGTAYTNSIVTGSRTGGPLSLLASQPAGGWGFPYAVDVRTSFDRYGSSSPSTGIFEITDTPNPGGLAEVGNANFSISVDTGSAIPAASWLAIGALTTNTSVAGIELLVQPAIVLAMTPGANPSAPLPIPNMPTLVGTRLFAQGIHLDTTGALQASNAVDVHIVR